MCEKNMPTRFGNVYMVTYTCICISKMQKLVQT